MHIVIDNGAFAGFRSLVVEFGNRDLNHLCRDHFDNLSRHYFRVQDFGKRGFELPDGVVFALVLAHIGSNHWDLLIRNKATVMASNEDVSLLGLGDH